MPMKEALDWSARGWNVEDVETAVCKLSGEVRDSVKLISLNLNYLRHVPACLGTFSSLSSLMLDQNPFLDITNLGDFKGLKSLVQCWHFRNTTLHRKSNESRGTLSSQQRFEKASWIVGELDKAQNVSSFVPAPLPSVLNVFFRLWLEGNHSLPVHLQSNVGGPLASDLDGTQKFLHEICLEERRQAARKAAVLWLLSSQE